MSSMEVTEKDEGISDVIALLQNIDVKKEASQSAELTEPQSEAQLNGHGSESNKKQTSDTHNSHGDTRQATKNENDKDKVETQPISETDEVAVDLSSPEQVLEMLETVDLTEEDTEALLQEAYNMNRKLKEILRRQQDSGGPTKSKSNKKKSKQNGEASSSTSVSSTSSMSNSRTGSASLRTKAVLPPIEKEGTSVYAVKLQRSRTNIGDIRQISSQAVPRSKSTNKESTTSQTRKSKVKSTEPKPDWNDRFNYT